MYTFFQQLNISTVNISILISILMSRSHNMNTKYKKIKIRTLQKSGCTRSKKLWQFSICPKKQTSMKSYENRASTEHYLPKILFPAFSDLHLRNFPSQRSD